MKTVLSQIAIAIASIVLAVSFASTLEAREPDGVQTARSFEKTISKSLALDYLLFLPADYEREPEKRWPMILFLHGAGERGTNLWLTTIHGPPKIVRHKPDFPFILVSPQCPAGRRWETETLVALLDHVLDQHRVDTSRVYLTGLSMGGYGTWDLAVRHPERFAAVAPICGSGQLVDVILASRDAEKGAALRSLPVWAFHGAKDSLIPLSESERMIAALERIGAENVQLTVYPDAQHDSWTVTYENPKLYEWFLQHQRKR